MSEAMKPKIAVWLEVNTSNENVVNEAIFGIRRWGKHPSVKTVIVSTVPGSEEIYTRILSHCQDFGLRLIPGIKTSAALPVVEVGEQKYRKLDDAAGWAAIAASVAKAAFYAESPDVVIEGESAVIGHTLGLVDVDIGDMASCFGCLPHGTRLLWHPSITSGQSERVLKQRDLLHLLLLARANVALFDTSISRRQAYEDKQAKLNYRTLRKYSYGQELYRILYCYGPDGDYWQGGDIVPMIVNAMRTTGGTSSDFFVLYPGAKRFAEAAHSIGPLLDLAFGAEQGS